MRLSFIKKEFFEFFRTYRFYVLFGIFVFFGILNAPLAKYLPEIIKAVPDVGFEISMPDPTFIDSYTQFTSNVTNAFFALIIIFMGSFSTEIKKGTIYLILSKGVSRFDFYFSKALNALVMYTAAYTAYSVVTIISTRILFGEWFYEGIFISLLSMYLFGLLLMTAAISASAIANSAGPGAFAGFGLLIFLPLTEFLGKAAPYLPGRLMSLPVHLMGGSMDSSDIVWPALVTLLLIAGMVTGSALLFRKREL